MLTALAHAVFKETPLAAKALETLMGAPEGLLASAIIGPVEPPNVLGLILMHRKETSLLETALLHENLTAEWMERVIPSLAGEGPGDPPEQPGHVDGTSQDPRPARIPPGGGIPHQAPRERVSASKS